LLGTDLAACRKALKATDSDHLHLLEKISINFSVLNSIVPSAVNIAKFRVTGGLPSLQLNVSDIKYQSLMKIIDVAIPKFDDNDGATSSMGQTPPPSSTMTFPSAPPLFGQATSEYNVHDDDPVDSGEGKSEGEAVVQEVDQVRDRRFVPDDTS
jgi:vacuolar protein sorting-associated protein 13A/C